MLNYQRVNFTWWKLMVEHHVNVRYSELLVYNHGIPISNWC